jgi:hypothetical protein
MLWQDQRESDNVEDERGSGGGGGGFGGGRIAIGGGLGGVIVVVLYLVLGGDPRALLQNQQHDQPSSAAAAASDTYPQQPQSGAPTDQLGKFVSVVLADTEDAWHEIFRQMGREYQEPKLVLFTSRTQSSCGLASSASGPFYCPEDRRVYIDLSFYRELQQRFGAPGEFAQAYVIAHEVGHHVQNLLGITQKVDQARAQMNKTEYNQLSVRLELQADFLAGVWARYADRTKHIVQNGDIDSALGAASAIGDDRLQRQAQGYVVPDSFTHGTSEQRVRWFKRGYETGDLSQGDTFNARDL